MRKPSTDYKWFKETNLKNKAAFLISFGITLLIGVAIIQVAGLNAVGPRPFFHWTDIPIIIGMFVFVLWAMDKAPR